MDDIGAGARPARWAGRMSGCPAAPHGPPCDTTSSDGIHHGRHTRGTLPEDATPECRGCWADQAGYFMPAAGRSRSPRLLNREPDAGVIQYRPSMPAPDPFRRQVMLSPGYRNVCRAAQLCSTRGPVTRTVDVSRYPYKMRALQDREPLIRGSHAVDGFPYRAPGRDLVACVSRTAHRLGFTRIRDADLVEILKEYGIPRTGRVDTGLGRLSDSTRSSQTGQRCHTGRCRDNRRYAGIRR